MLVVDRKFSIFRPIRWYLAMDCNYVHQAPDGMASTTSYFKSVPAIMMNNLDTHQQITEAIERVEILSEHFTRDGLSTKSRMSYCILQCITLLADHPLSPPG